MLRTVGLVLLAMLLHGASPASAAEDTPDVARLVTAAKTLDLAPGRHATNVSVPIGAPTLSLRDGMSFPVTDEDGAQVGHLEGGGYVVEGTLEQDPTQFAKIAVPFVAQIRGGGTVIEVVTQDKPKTPFVFNLPGEPQSIDVDPNKNNLARYQRRS